MKVAGILSLLRGGYRYDYVKIFKSIADGAIEVNTGH